MDSIAQTVKPSTKPAASNDLSFMPFINAMRAFKREKAKNKYPEKPGFTIFGDYTFYVVMNKSKNEGIFDNFFKMPYFKESDARAAMEALKLQNSDDEIVLGHGYFSLDDPSLSSFVHYFDNVNIESIDNQNIEEWLIAHRQSFAEKARIKLNTILPLHYLNYNDPIENCPEFLERAAWRESPEYSLDLHYFCVQVEHHEVLTTGFGEAIFFHLKDAIAYKNQVQAKYPDCRFALDGGGFLLSSLDKRSALIEIENENQYVKDWRQKQIERIIKIRQITQAANPSYWHYYRVETVDGLAHLSPLFYTEDAALEYLEAVKKDNPTLELTVEYRLVAPSTLPEFDLRLNQIHCPYQREFIRLHRERIAAMEESTHA